MVAVVYIACQALKSDGLDGNQKIIAVAVTAPMLVILGLATLITGVITHAKTSTNDLDLSAHPGDGRAGP